MNKLLLFFTLLLSFSSIKAQTTYKAKSGHIFKVGDTLKLGQPITISSGPIVATTGEWATVFNKKNEKLRNMNFINKKAVISEINTVGDAKLHFKLYGKKLYILVDEAISLGEMIVTYESKDNSLDKYDKIKKLKELLDIGALSKEEFESEKKKLLNSN